MNEFSPAELALAKALFCDHLCVAYENHPIGLYNTMAVEVLIRRMEGPAVDALRRALHTINHNYGKPYRRTKEWDDMIQFTV